jgi:hypothetical protein
VKFGDGGRQGRRWLRPWPNRDEESALCVCCFGEEGSGEFFFVAKITCTESGVREGLITKVMPTLGCKMEVQDLRCVYVH